MSDVGWPQARLHIVTGKGGTGKTTVAAALAVALADQGRRVLLAEVEERQGISQAFDVPPLGATEVKVATAANGGEVFGLSVDARKALLEYLQIFYKLGRAGGVLERFGAVDFATTIAPGVRDVLLVGRIYEAARRRHDLRHHRHSHPDELLYDAIVMDAPPTGRVCRFLSVGSEVAGLARVGPIRAQADSMTEMLHSPRTVVHVVTLLEEMPVQETVDVVAELRAIGMPLGAVIVNQARTGSHEGTSLDAARRHRRRPSYEPTWSRSASASATDWSTGWSATSASTPSGWPWRSTSWMSSRALGMPLVTVPALVDGVDTDAIYQIAELLTQQGMAR